MIDRESVEKIENERIRLQKQIEELFYSPSRVARIQEIAHILGAETFVDIDHKKGVISFRAKDYVDSLVEKYKQTDIELQLPTAVDIENAVVFPAGEGEIQTGSGEGVEKKREFPRNALFIELLSEHNIPYENPRISKTSEDMMRGEGYTVYFLPTLEKTVCVNNEERNATIILFGTQSYEDAREIFRHNTKDQIREQYQNIAVCIDWNETYVENPQIWKQRIHTVLTELTPSTKKEAEEEVLTKEKRDRYDIKKRISQLQAAFEAWRQLDPNSRGKFNTAWLNNNGHQRIPAWAKRNGGIEALVALCSQDLQDAFTKEIVGVEYPTLESQKVHLEAAFEIWIQSDPDSRGKFNTAWLEKNGYKKLCVRMYATDYKSIRICSLELQQAFEKRHVRTKSEQEEELKEVKTGLENAFTAWKSSDIKTRGPFNKAWLDKNGYSDLYEDMVRNGGVSKILALCPTELQEVYDNSKKSNEVLKINLEAAFEHWQSLQQQGQTRFNLEWLRKNGHRTLFDDLTKHEDLKSLISMCSPELQNAFERQEQRTPASAQIELENAFSAWSTSENSTQKRFNKQWLINNGYGGLYMWIYRYSDIDTLVNKCSLELQNAFYKK